MPVIQYEAKTHPLMVVDAEYIDQVTEQLLLTTATEAALPKVREAIQQIRGRERRYQLAATAEQQAIGWGDCFRYTWKPDGRHILAGSLAEGVTIYGQVMTRAEVRHSELAAGASHDEAQAALRRIMHAYGRGWRHGRCYSVIEPDGESGDTHVAVMTPITAGEFEAARAAGWPT